MEQLGPHPAGFQKKTVCSGTLTEFRRPDNSGWRDIGQELDGTLQLAQTVLCEVRTEAQKTAEHQAIFILNVGRRLLKHLDSNFSCLRYLDDYRL